MLGSLLIAKYGFGEDIGTRPMLIVGTLAMLSSVQFICFGIMAEMLTRIYHESGNRTTYVVRNTSSHHQAADSGVNDSLMMKKAG